MKLEVKQIEKHFGSRPILTNVNIHLQTGETVGIFGRNGCGKSTLMKVLFGTIKATASSVFLDNTQFHPRANISRKLIAYLPQVSFLPLDMKVRNLIQMIFSDGETQNHIFYAPGVALFENQKVGSLSLGTLKYLEFLLIANMDHPFLMLDEPFSMIDPLFHEIIKNIIVSQLTTKAILITDHYYTDVWDVTQRNYVLANGATLPVRSQVELATYGYLPIRS
ncbi:ATP-binding cassette domain-containing protein [Dyadobacter chenwenxiniae]|uniref:ATP-binding cassette domain-containing protein n=1 Tax=Dyadobacter chenwenxiniae TaxID=2906456 RepID=A0A9X1PHX8_9BACT|nr:ATP-binding cassette domain-containing protein [Dyadobacter chenwenxiniae]MCF0061350.1 ATP-binding cassette domain-containing protein [Dyadobacter chenwenxiniae]UON81172.1 ATP-binding cassette domain-containing protein [Dyadobacter chenwenxiniae]